MKNLLLVALAAALSGCVVAPPGPPSYGTRAPAYAGDPSQWHVVSVTPVPAGTGARMAASGQVEYSSQPAVRYVPQPVYVQQPVYVPAPVYYDPAPVHFSIGLGLGYLFGHGWGHGGHRHHHRR